MAKIGVIIPINNADYLAEGARPLGWCNTQPWYTNESMEIEGPLGRHWALVAPGLQLACTVQVGISVFSFYTGITASVKFPQFQAWVCYPNTMPGLQADLIVPSMRPPNPNLTFTEEIMGLPGGETPHLPANPSSTAYQSGSYGWSGFISLTPAWRPIEEDLMPPNLSVQCSVVVNCYTVASGNDNVNGGGFIQATPQNSFPLTTAFGSNVESNGDSISSKVSICTNPLQGQLNIMLFNWPLVPNKGLERPRLEFGFLSGNIHRDRQSAVVVEVSEVDQGDQVDPSVLRRLQSGQHRGLPLRPPTLPPAHLRLRENRYECKGRLAEITRKKAEEIVEDFVDPAKHTPGEKRGRRIKLTLPPGGRQPLLFEMELDPAEPVGTVHAFDIIQTDDQGTRGGIRAIVVVVPS